MLQCHTVHCLQCTIEGKRGGRGAQHSANAAAWSFAFAPSGAVLRRRKTPRRRPRAGPRPAAGGSGRRRDSGLQERDACPWQPPFGRNRPMPVDYARTGAHPSAGATWRAMVPSSLALYSTPSWLGTVSRSVSAACTAVSAASSRGYDVRLADIALAEAGQGAVEGAHLVPALAEGAEPEVLPVLVVGQGQDAAADRNARFVAVPGRRPRLHGTSRSARPGARRTAPRCPPSAGWSSSGSSPAPPPRPPSSGFRRPTRSARAAPRTGAGSAAARWLPRRTAGPPPPRRRRLWPAGTPRRAGAPCPRPSRLPAAHSRRPPRRSARARVNRG